MTDPLTALREGLRDRYSFERELGRGGIYFATYNDLYWVQLLPVSQSVTFGVYLQELLARIYTMAGKPAQAVERFEVVLAHPSLLSRDRLRIDPHFAPLRGDPAFQRLLQGKS